MSVLTSVVLVVTLGVVDELVDAVSLLLSADVTKVDVVCEDFSVDSPVLRDSHTLWFFMTRLSLTTMAILNVTSKIAGVIKYKLIHIIPDS